MTVVSASRNTPITTVKIFNDLSLTLIFATASKTSSFTYKNAITANAPDRAKKQICAIGLFDTVSKLV